MLSIVAICRDEEANVKAFLNSWLPVADEIVILDTGSVDNTIPLLHKAAAASKKVFFFEAKWKHSFAAARNEAAGHACGNWILWADLDDRVDENSIEKIRAIASKPALFAVEFQVASKVGENQFSRFLQTRMYPTFNHRTQFVGDIHETLTNSIKELGIPVEIEPDVIIVHLGYEDNATRITKALRNYSMLMATDPEKFTSDTYIQLGDCMFILGKFFNGLGYYEEAVRTANNPSVVRDLIAEKLIIGYMSQQMYDKALEVSDDMPQDTLEHHFWRGQIMYAMGEKIEAMKWYRLAKANAESTISEYPSNADVIMADLSKILTEEDACLA